MYGVSRVRTAGNTTASLSAGKVIIETVIVAVPMTGHLGRS